MFVITSEVVLPRENHIVQHGERIEFHRSAAFGETLLSLARANFDPAGNLMGIRRIGVKRESLLNLRFRFWEVPEIVEIEIC